MLRGVAPLMDYKPGDVLFGEYNLTSFMGVQLSNDHNFSERELSSLLALAERPAEPPASALQLGELLGEPFGRKNIGGRKNTGRPAHRRLRRGPPGPQHRHGVPAAGAHAPGEAGGPNKGRRAGPQQPVKTDNMVLGRPVPLYRPPTPTGYSIPGSGPQGFLGSGNFGDVWRAKKGNQRVVLKFMVDPTTRLHSTGRQASPDAKKEYSNDCEVPRLIQHAVRNNGRLAPYARHFAKCFASTAGNDPNYQDQPVYVALEDAGDGCKDLNGWVPKNVNEPYRITPSSMKNFAQQLLEALALVHHVGVVHQDTKPENIMITARGVLWLVDFGRANRLDHQEDQTFFGDGGWMGPEASRQPFTTSPGVDMWSAGLTFLFMFTGGNFFKLGPGFPPVNLANGGRKRIIQQMCSTREGAAMCPKTHALNNRILDQASHGVFRRNPQQRVPAATILKDLFGDASAPPPTTRTKSQGGGMMRQMPQGMAPQGMPQFQMPQFQMPQFQMPQMMAPQFQQPMPQMMARPPWRGLLQQEEREEEKQAPARGRGRHRLRAPILAGGLAR